MFSRYVYRMFMSGKEREREGKERLDLLAYAKTVECQKLWNPP